MMKKIIFLFLLSCGITAATAQTKLSDTALEGRWIALSVEVPGKFYYNKALDSIAIHADIKKDMPKEMLDHLIAAGKASLKALSGFFVEFKKDKKIRMKFMDQVTDGIYILTDSTIQIREDSGSGDTIRAKFIDDNLQVIIGEQENEVVLLLKKEEK